MLKNWLGRCSAIDVEDYFAIRELKVRSSVPP
jgi:hypothetical protein